MTWTITPERPDSPAAAALWRAYYTEVSDRWYQLYEGRSTDPDELEREMGARTRRGRVAPVRGRPGGPVGGRPGGAGGGAGDGG
ncbi:GNAT family N-acetyltransferase, partial [Streptomyces sp. NPDC057062]